jgi:alanine dehydrogenase
MHNNVERPEPLSQPFLLPCFSTRCASCGLAEGFRALSEGLVSAPKRNEVSVPNTGFLLAMPAYQHGREVTVKLVSVFHGNERLGIPGHQALICLSSYEH